jgi:hypothetical protein
MQDYLKLQDTLSINMVDYLGDKFTQNGAYDDILIDDMIRDLFDACDRMRTRPEYRKMKL